MAADPRQEDYRRALHQVIDQMVKNRFPELAHTYPDKFVMQVDLQDWLNMRVGSAERSDPR